MLSIIESYMYAKDGCPDLWHVHFGDKTANTQMYKTQTRSIFEICWDAKQFEELGPVLGFTFSHINKKELTSLLIKIHLRTFPATIFRNLEIRSSKNMKLSDKTIKLKRLIGFIKFVVLWELSHNWRTASYARSYVRWVYDPEHWTGVFILVIVSPRKIEESDVWGQGSYTESPFLAKQRNSNHVGVFFVCF